MSTRQRVALLAGAAVVAVAAFLVLRPDDDEPAREASQPAVEPPTGAEPTQTTAEEPAPRPKPKVTRIQIRGGQPVGGETTVAVENGETIRLLVQSDVADEVHVHGYDLSRPVGPGQPAPIRFKANIEGVFEVELEERAVPIAQLEVRP